MDDFWVTESNTYKIYADSVDEAKEIWNKYCNGTPSSELPMKLKAVELDADWEEEV